VLQYLFLFVNVILQYYVGQCPVYITLTIVSVQCLFIFTKCHSFTNFIFSVQIELNLNTILVI
jgi:hypothetical protein